MPFPSDKELSGTCNYFNPFFKLGWIMLPFQIPCLFFIYRKINQILDSNANKSYCFISLWMMYVMFILFIFYIIGSIFIISNHILNSDHVRNFYWRLICTTIGQLGVILGTFIGSFVMA